MLGCLKRRCGAAQPWYTSVLPYDILRRILRYVSIADPWHRAASVCRFWRTIIHEEGLFWTALRLNDTFPGNRRAWLKVKRALHSGTLQLKALFVENCECLHSALSGAMTTSPHLTTVSIYKPTSFLTIPAKPQPLKATAAMSVRNLQIGEMHGNNWAFLSSLFTAWDLEVLCVSFSENVSHAIIDSQRCLVYLNLYLSVPNGETIAVLIGNNSNTLEMLCLGHQLQDDSVALRDLALCQRLRLLDFGAWNGEVSAATRHAIRSLPALESLSLTFLHRMWEVELRELFAVHPDNGLRNLRALQLGGCSGLSNRVIGDIAKLCGPKLLALELGGDSERPCIYLTADAASAIIESCPELRYFATEKCYWSQDVEDLILAPLMHPGQLKAFVILDWDVRGHDLDVGHLPGTYTVLCPQNRSDSYLAYYGRNCPTCVPFVSLTPKFASVTSPRVNVNNFSLETYWKEQIDIRLEELRFDQAVSITRNYDEVHKELRMRQRM